MFFKTQKRRGFEEIEKVIDIIGSDITPDKLKEDMIIETLRSDALFYNGQIDDLQKKALGKLWRKGIPKKEITIPASMCEITILEGKKVIIVHLN